MGISTVIGVCVGFILFVIVEFVFRNHKLLMT